MVLRLIIAFTRWTWGISPAFVTADSAEWYVVMVFGLATDIAVITTLIFVFMSILNRKTK